MKKNNKKIHVAFHWKARENHAIFLLHVAALGIAVLALPERNKKWKVVQSRMSEYWLEEKYKSWERVLKEENKFETLEAFATHQSSIWISDKPTSATSFLLKSSEDGITNNRVTL